MRHYPSHSLRFSHLTLLSDLVVSLSQLSFSHLAIACNDEPISKKHLIGNVRLDFCLLLVKFPDLRTLLTLSALFIGT